MAGYSGPIIYKLGLSENEDEVCPKTILGNFRWKIVVIQ